MAIKEIMAKSGGITFTATIKDKDTGAIIPLQSATTKEFRAKPAHAKGITKKITAAFAGDGSDGKIKFTTTTTTFDAPGDWNVQAYLIMTGYSGYTTLITIKVLEILEAA